MTFTIRDASANDLELILAHRRRMYEDMATSNAEALDRMQEAFRPWLEERLRQERYRHWFAIDDVSGRVAAGTGLWLMDWPPGQYEQNPYRGYVLNVYTEPDFRRQGLGKQLILHCLRWCWDNNIRTITLHASHEGRQLYEAVGFVPTNEMRISQK
jgi:GNAT superfamily N-acetyltransferase